MNDLEKLSPERLWMEHWRIVRKNNDSDIQEERRYVTEILRELKAYRAMKKKLEHYVMLCQYCNPNEILAAEKEDHV